MYIKNICHLFIFLQSPCLNLFFLGLFSLFSLYFFIFPFYALYAVMIIIKWNEGYALKLMNLLITSVSRHSKPTSTPNITTTFSGTHMNIFLSNYRGNIFCKILWSGGGAELRKKYLKNWGKGLKVHLFGL